MTAILDTYCRNERPEFSLFGKFVRKKDDSSENSVGLDIALIKSDLLEIYKVTADNKIEYVTSCRLLLAPIASATIKGADGIVDYVALLFMNFEIIIYRYSAEYDELELLSKDSINIEDLLEGSGNIKSCGIIDVDENVKMEQILFGSTLDSNKFSIMVTFAKCLIFVTYKIDLSGYYGQKLVLDLCWGISSETDLLVDTIIDSCLIHDEHSQMCLQPRIALLTRIGPVSNGSIQSHSNSSSLLYLNLNMRISDFTVLEKLELLPIDVYKVVPIDTERYLNSSLTGGVVVFARSCVIIHGGLQRPFTLVNVNDHYKTIPEKKLEIDICTGRIHSFSPKVFGIETGEITGGSLQVSSVGENYAISSNENKASAGANTPYDKSRDFGGALPSLQPILLDDSELSIDLDISHSVPFITNNNYYGMLLFNRVQPYLILLIFQISNEKPSGISKYFWIKVNEYWDWNRAYLGGSENTIISLETTGRSKETNSGVSESDEHYLLTVMSVFPVQNGCIIRDKNALETGDALLCMVGDFSSNSGVSLFRFSLGPKFSSTSKMGDYKDSGDSLSNIRFAQFGYGSIVESVRNMEKNRDNKDNSSPNSGKKKIKHETKPQSILDLERDYITSGFNEKLNCTKEANAVTFSEEKCTLNLELLDYLDLGPPSLRDFCLIPDKENEGEENSEFGGEVEMSDQRDVSNNNTIKLSIDDNHSILATNGSYPIGQLCLYMKYISKYTIASFSLDDIIFHWVVNDPFSGKTKYLIFTTDPLKSIGKTYVFSLENNNCEMEDNGDKNNCNNQIIIGDVNQLDPSEGEYEFESDSNTVGTGIIQLGKESFRDVYVVQILSSSINILDYELRKRLLEIDFINFLFNDRMDAPLAIKSFIVNNKLIVILFEDSSMRVLRFTSNDNDNDKNIKDCEKRVFENFTILLEDNLELTTQLRELSKLNVTVINQRVGVDGDVSQRLENFGEDEKNKLEDVFWIRHISKMVSYDEKFHNEMLLVLVVYSKVWLSGSLVIYDLESKRIIFFSPYISLVPPLLGNVISPLNSNEDTIYRFLECEFDLGRPITCLSTPIIEPKVYSYEGNSLSISTCINFDYDSTDSNDQVQNLDIQNSFLISSELVKLSSNGDMLLIATVSQKPTLIYRLNVNFNSDSTDSGGSTNNFSYGAGDFGCSLQESVLRGKWNLQIQPNCSNIQMDIRKFFPLFPRILTSENVSEAFSDESPLSTYNSGHIVLFSNNVDTWVFQPPIAINSQENATQSNSGVQKEKQKYCSSIVILYNRRKVSIIDFESKRSVSCIASINSPWSSTQILLTTDMNNEIKFRYLNIPQSCGDNSKTPDTMNSNNDSEMNKVTEDKNLDKALSTIPFLGRDNWFIRKAYLPELVVQRVSYCKKHKLVALIVGIPDNAKHHLNGYHIRQMAFYRYLRCLEAGGKEGQTILMNQDLIRNPEKCFEKSLTSIPDLGIPSSSYETETYFDTLPPGIEIGEILPKIIHQSNLENQKERSMHREKDSRVVKQAENRSNMAEDDNYLRRDFENEQFSDLLDLDILRNELLIFSMDDLFPQSKPAFSLFDSNIRDFPKPIGRFAFGAWEIGLSVKFGKDPKGQDLLVVGTGTNPTQYFEAEGRLLVFKVKQLFSNNDDDRLKGNADFSNMNGDSSMFQMGVRSGIVNNGASNNSTNSKWLSLIKYWPSKFSQDLYYNNVPELEVYYSSMFRGPVTCVDLIDLPATTASIAPAIPALAAYPIIQNNPIIRAPTSNITYLLHTFGYRLFVHELKENDTGFVKGSFMDTPLGITSVSNYKALFFLGDIRRGVHLGMLKTDVSRGSQTMVKLARSHPLWKFTCTSAHAIIRDRDMAILVSDNKNNIFTFEPSFDSTQIIDKETLKPTSHTYINTTIVHMRTIKSGNENYVVASGRNGSFFLARLIDGGQKEKFCQLEKLLYSNIPSFLGISPKTIQLISNNQESIPDFVKGLYPTSKIFLLKHLDYIKYLSNPILKSIFKNSNFTFNGISQFIV